MTSTPWYRDGLRFGCTGCGHCCTGAPGYVWVRKAEIEALARHLDIPLDRFGRECLRRVGSRYSLIERANGDCLFWQPGQGCTVYPARPEQCRTFPFWPENLRSRRAWEETAADCPGVGQGRLFTVEEIGRIRGGEGEVSSA